MWSSPTRPEQAITERWWHLRPRQPGRLSCNGTGKSTGFPALLSWSPRWSRSNSRSGISSRPRGLKREESTKVLSSRFPCPHQWTQETIVLDPQVRVAAERFFVYDLILFTNPLLVGLYGLPNEYLKSSNFWLFECGKKFPLKGGTCGLVESSYWPYYHHHLDGDSRNCVGVHWAQGWEESG